MHGTVRQRTAGPRMPPGASPYPQLGRRAHPRQLSYSALYILLIVGPSVHRAHLRIMHVNAQPTSV